MHHQGIPAQPKGLDGDGLHNLAFFELNLVIPNITQPSLKHAEETGQLDTARVKPQEHVNLAWIWPKRGWDYCSCMAWVKKLHHLYVMGMPWKVSFVVLPGDQCAGQYETHNTDLR